MDQQSWLARQTKTETGLPLNQFNTSLSRPCRLSSMVGPGEPAGNKIENNQTLLGLTLQSTSTQTDRQCRQKKDAGSDHCALGHHEGAEMKIHSLADQKYRPRGRHHHDTNKHRLCFQLGRKTFGRSWGLLKTCLLSPLT